MKTEIKRIIERNLPLNVKYNLIDKSYTSLIDSIGCTCHNCGKLISNIATVRPENGKEIYLIGFDCLETILINNNLLDGKSIEEFNKFKSHLPTFIKHSKQIKDNVNEMNRKNLNKVVSIQFELEDFKQWAKYGKSSYLTYYYILETGKKFNDNLRLKNEINIEDFINTFKSINNKINVQLN